MKTGELQYGEIRPSFKFDDEENYPLIKSNYFEAFYFIIFLVDAEIELKFKNNTDLNKLKLQYYQKLSTLLEKEYFCLDIPAKDFMEMFHIKKEIYSKEDFIKAYNLRKEIYTPLYKSDLLRLKQQLFGNFCEQSITQFVELYFLNKIYKIIPKKDLKYQILEWFRRVIPSIYGNI